MEIATTMQQPIPAEPAQAIVAGTGNGTSSGQAPAQEGLFALFFAQMLNVAEAQAPSVGTLLSPQVGAEHVELKENSKEETAKQEGSSQDKPATVQIDPSAQLQAMAAMQMVQQPLPVMPRPQPAAGGDSQQTSAQIPLVEANAGQSPAVKTGETAMPAVKAGETAMPAVAPEEILSLGIKTGQQVPLQTAPQVGIPSTVQQAADQKTATLPEPSVKPDKTGPLSLMTVQAPAATIEAVPQQAAPSVPGPQNGSAEAAATKTQPVELVVTQHAKVFPLKGEIPQKTEAASETAGANTGNGTGPIEILVKEATPQEGSTSGERREQNLSEKGKSTSQISSSLPTDAGKLAEQNRFQASIQAKADNAPVSDHEHIMAQVKEKLASHDVNSGNGQISFTLHPQELGELKITMRMDDQQRLKVEIFTQNHTVREALMNNLDGLRETLNRQNITVDRFDVNTGGGNFNQAFQEGKQTSQNRFSQPYPQFGGSFAEPEQKTVSYWQPQENSLVDVRF